MRTDLTLSIVTFRNSVKAPKNSKQLTALVIGINMPFTSPSGTSRPPDRNLSAVSLTDGTRGRVLEYLDENMCLVNAECNVECELHSLCNSTDNLCF